VCNPKTTQPTENEQYNERQNANASAKSKELQPNAKVDTVAAHLLLPQPHSGQYLISKTKTK